MPFFGAHYTLFVTREMRPTVVKSFKMIVTPLNFSQKRYEDNVDLGSTFRRDCAVMRSNGTQIIKDESGEKEIRFSYVDRFHTRVWKNTALWDYSGDRTGISFSENSYSCGSSKNGKCNKPIPSYKS